MWGCGTPAKWQDGGSDFVPRLPCRSGAASRASRAPEPRPSAPPSAMRTTPATQNDGMLATLKDQAAKIGGWQTHLSKAPISAPSSGSYSGFSCPRSQKNMPGAKHIRGFLHAAVSLCGPWEGPFHLHCGDCACLLFTVLLIYLSRLARKWPGQLSFSVIIFTWFLFFYMWDKTTSIHLDWGIWYLKPLALPKSFLQEPAGLRCHACLAAGSMSRGFLRQLSSEEKRRYSDRNSNALLPVQVTLNPSQ